MKDFLASKLLSKAMDWDTDEIRNDLLYLQTMAKFKYDSYQNYQPGRQFIESLALWINQFEKKDRKMALEFVKNDLIYFSNEQIFQFISVSYPMFIQKYILTELEKNKISFKYNTVNNLYEYKVIKRKILFLGLSDGSKIEIFRRIHDLDNEQVSVTYDLSDSKIKDLKSDLKNCKIHNKTLNADYYHTIYLIDDFSASGISFLRFNTEKQKFGGKINTILERIVNSALIENNKPIDINIILYISTNKAKTTILHNFQLLKNSDKKRFEHINLNVNVVQLIPDENIYSLTSNTKFINFLKKESNDDWKSKHTKIGKCENPYLGFDECGLPLVLNHNTPNNSLPIIWFGGRNKQPIFDRISRHKEN